MNQIVLVQVLRIISSHLISYRGISYHYAAGTLSSSAIRSMMSSNAGSVTKG